MLITFCVFYILAFMLLVGFFRDAVGLSWKKSILLGFTCAVPVMLEAVYSILNFFLRNMVKLTTEVGFILGGEDSKSINTAIAIRQIDKALGISKGDVSEEEPSKDDTLQ